MSAKLIIFMVGLPARGKSYTVKKLARYLNWLQYRTRIFNAGDRRRVIGLEEHPGSQDMFSADFFDPNDERNVSIRDEIALSILDDLLHWIEQEGGVVGILDATNTTIERRQLLLTHLYAHATPTPEFMFLESVCTDPLLLAKNLHLKLSGPDYRLQDPEVALQDLMRRVSNYESHYVPLGPFEETHNMPYVQMINVGQKINTFMIDGFLSTKVVEYLLNFHLTDRQIWISCNGESFDDAIGRIGRPSDLTEQGKHYAQALADFISKEQLQWDRRKKNEPTHMATESRNNNGGSCSTNGSSHFIIHRAHCSIWTSTMPQAIQTAAYFCPRRYKRRQIKVLDDLNPGHVAGMTFDEISHKFPDEFEARRRDKLFFRWSGQGGEGYIDVINRLRDVIIELERVRHHVVLVTHRAVVRVLLAYFLGLQRDDLAEIKIPKEHVFSLEPVCVIIYSIDRH
ncbi:uncharacterized protein PV09_08960 [Verruconis gallopava]|uniref:6-phosphofructo-2-kinase domain-containing protein n=1 Tax=Verruconis gallopava TaxID=253628 RepID=A0A0D1ZY81_9PEZI|nr:uncharacterized protein PV09_08960 [Verruconis gallopava]KIV99422.1 hypothetical protein PV09_08960 [Verruconis gallopava]